jgi:hypothetical protein
MSLARVKLDLLLPLVIRVFDLQSVPCQLWTLDVWALHILRHDASSPLAMRTHKREARVLRCGRDNRPQDASEKNTGADENGT